MSYCGTGTLQLNLCHWVIKAYSSSHLLWGWWYFWLFNDCHVTQPSRLEQLCRCDCRDLSGGTTQVQFLTLTRVMSRASVLTPQALGGGLTWQKPAPTCTFCVFLCNSLAGFATHAPLHGPFLRLGALLSQMRPVISGCRSGICFLIQKKRKNDFYAYI